MLLSELEAYIKMCSIVKVELRTVHRAFEKNIDRFRHIASPEKGSLLIRTKYEVLSSLLKLISEEKCGSVILHSPPWRMPL